MRDACKEEWYSLRDQCTKTSGYLSWKWTSDCDMWELFEEAYRQWYGLEEDEEFVLSRKDEEFVLTKRG